MGVHSEQGISQKPDLMSRSPAELAHELSSAGFPSYRAGQVYRWLHVRLVRDVDEMTNLPKELKVFLREHYRVSGVRVAEHQVSRADGTQKFLFELADGETVESVYMKYHYGSSVCVSSQVGCRMGCRFCASAIGGLSRNLLSGEMLEEVYAIQRSLRGSSWGPGDSLRKEDAAPASEDRDSRSTKRTAASGTEGGGAAPSGGERISHVVIMGTGEPLDNYDNVIRFLRMLTDENGLHLSARNVTLSTCGIVPKIYELAGEGLPVTLALSLHAVTDEKRRQIMPIANRYRIDECIEACRFYAQTTGRRVTFEYSLISGVNDTEEDAAMLARLARRVGEGGEDSDRPAHPDGKGRSREKESLSSDRGCIAAHVNLIPVNPVTESGFRRPDPSAVRAFQTKLEKRGINVSIRRALGRDIDGACGQLRHRHALRGDPS